MSFQKSKDLLVRPLVRLMPWWITPNLLTGLRIMLVIPLLYALLQRRILLAIIIMAMALLTDMIDGGLARLRGQETKAGKYFDPLADKILLLVPFIILGYEFLRPSLYIAILVTEGIAMLASVTYPVLMRALTKRSVAFHVTVFGQVKISLYGIGIIALLTSIRVPQLLPVSSLLFAIGLFISVISILYSLLNPKTT